ncbi:MULTISPECIES: ABC transporter ATP-binding protein [unclassified Breznakia]|uniref:ABC transporter ATP-binding protein n=1 Tax=unclassified Breznakia TaxID=2623764 RepID=UPI0024750724|nr:MULTISPECIES: ABC transporter ATP-binding protein [unclassified Breznakia]MDH6367631.1 ATP-binding cassette subfamily B protein [Breznakia sp. PH1-1]MDH6403981.1 ATP-binding cassette subfamily B protein [Breznakia sp. PF1-11]MDH6411690.1 ATP-binding cassette subfamily B protein [Breznakia sp. PFB1-11]MDH6414760.1 ATP-binding cassette subfamily B protein [Breznakia sp. PFB1-14]MDH6416041.1 ATP-binding cassette subfamily B protein [Breznakia sp. PFB1-4]
MSKRMKKFLSYYKPYKKIFFTDMFCAFVASAVTLVFPLMTRYVANDVLGSGGSIEMDTIAIFAGVFLVLVIIEYICNYYVAYRGHVMGAFMEADMRNELFQHYQKLSFSFYDDQKVGQLMTRLTNDLFSLTELYHHGPEDIVISFIRIVGAFAILLAIHVPLTLIMFALIPFMIVFAIYYNKQMKRAFKANRQKIGDINARIEDSLSGIRVVKSFANEEAEMNRFSHENSLWIDTKRNSYHKMGRFHAGIGAFISMLSVIIIIGGAYFISIGEMNAGDLIAYLLYISNLTDPIKRLINFTETFQDGVSGFERFMELLEIHPDIEDAPNAIELKDVKGNVDFEHVYFRYNEKSDYVLRDVNLQVRSGEYIALVGQSGAGKTTMCSLIPRFYELSDGVIRIDGISNRDVTLSSLRNHIGVVQQDVYLFAGTIMDNIAYGNPNASEEDIIRAAKQANAHDFIVELEDGYDTDIGSRGVKLSGGQKQRISIARVFLKNPSILIFDEATSALDNESEKVVQESLEQLAKNRTTFVIAHRLSTIKNAQRIVVLGESGIDEVGSHDELLAKNGEYAKLYEMQFR